MRKAKSWNRLLSLVLCICMVLSLLPGIPLSAKAAGTDGMITIEMVDSYGDGWNGNAIEIYANGALLDTATIDKGSTGTWSAALDTHATYTFKWVSGDYASETSFVIYAGTEEKLSAVGTDYSTGDTILTLEATCSQPEFENSVCVNCGQTCVHSFTDSVCTICGFVCGTTADHGWSDCVCNVCGAVCTHESVTNGVCDTCSGICGTTFDHSFDSTYVCESCGFSCAEHNWSAGVCSVCGAPCAHSFDDAGFCGICKYYESAPDINGDGYYEISTAGQLYWFAAQVNGGNKTMNAVLQQDIVVNEGIMTAASTNARSWTPIGYDNVQDLVYQGIFDGQNHTISGLYFTDVSANWGGLFGIISSSAVVQNVTVANSYFSGKETIGAVAGQNNGFVINCHNRNTAVSGYAGGYNGEIGGVVGLNLETIERCTNTGNVSGQEYIGGIVGHIYNRGTVSDCSNHGTVTGTYDVGGIVGISRFDATVTDCYNTGTVSGRECVGGVVGSFGSSGTATNNYYLSESETEDGGKTAEQFASGEVAYLLGEGWGQTIGQDAYPVLGGDAVYLVTDCDGVSQVYSNTNENVGHSFTDGVCVNCGAECTHRYDEALGGCADCKLALYSVTLSDPADFGGNWWYDQKEFKPYAVPGEDYHLFVQVEDGYYGSVRIYVDGVQTHAFYMANCELTIPADTVTGSVYIEVTAAKVSESGSEPCCYCGQPVFTWAEDFSSATATMTCCWCDNTVSGQCEITVQSSSTCIVAGVNVYTATVTLPTKGYQLEDAVYTGTRSVPAQIDPENHTNFRVEYDWSIYDDGTCYVYATLRCADCDGWIDSNSDYAEQTGSVEAIDCQNPGSVTYSITLTLNGQEYTGSETFEVKSHNHTALNKDGFCSACGGYQMPELDLGEDPEWEYDDVYLVYNAGQLFWVADYVNNVSNDIKVKLMDDIVVPEGMTWTPILDFYGTFDGNFKTVSGLYVNAEGEYVAMFGGGYYSYGTIKNLRLTDCYFEGTRYVGGIAGYHAGTIENCSVDGTVTVVGDGYVGALVGSLAGNMYNCYAYAPTLIGTYNSSYSTVENCYYLSDTDDGMGGKTAEQFASGEVAFLLQSGIQGEDIYDDDWNYIETIIPEIWGQTIGEDAYPVLKGEKVYEGYVHCDVPGYTNDADSKAEPHSYIDGVCDVCDRVCTHDTVADGKCGECGTKMFTVTVDNDKMGYGIEIIEGAHAFACADYTGKLELISRYAPSSDFRFIITIGGQPTTNYSLVAGVLTVPAEFVTGDIVITCEGELVRIDTEIDCFDYCAGALSPYTVEWAEDYSSATFTYTCAFCDDVLSNTVGVSCEVISQPTCTEDGLNRYGAAYGDFQAAKDVPTEKDPLAHTWQDATCTAPKTCIGCGAQEGDVDADNHTSADYTYKYYRNRDFNRHEKFHARCGVSAGMEDHSYNGQTGLCNECDAEILIIVEMINAPTEYLTHVEYALRRGGRSATLLKNYTNTGSYTVAVDELFFAEGVTLTNNGTLTLPETFTYDTIPGELTGGTVTIGGSSYIWNGSKYLCVTHSYENNVCTVCGHDITPVKLESATLSFKEMIHYNIFFSLGVDENVELADMGLIMFDSLKADGTVDDAIAIYSGAVEMNGMYMVATDGVHAKRMGDTIYFRVYAKLADGSYVYSKTVEYSAVTYAQHILSSNQPDSAKALVVAMLNYGAEAQLYFGYNTDNLANASLTEEQRALVKEYQPDMLAPVAKPDSSKLGSFASTGTGFSKRAPAVSFEGSFVLNYFFTPSEEVAGDMTLYYWTAADYEAATELTAENATGSIVMQSGAEYRAALDGIFAKDVDSTVYVAAVYSDGTTTHCTGVLPYSIGAYLTSHAAKETDFQTMAQAAAVYCSYCKEYFNG